MNSTTLDGGNVEVYKTREIYSDKTFNGWNDARGCSKVWCRKCEALVACVSDTNGSDENFASAMKWAEWHIRENHTRFQPISQMRSPGGGRALVRFELGNRAE